jgi:CheY-like chemotaxis protein
MLIFDPAGQLTAWNAKLTALLEITGDVPAWLEALDFEAPLAVALQATDAMMSVNGKPITLVSRTLVGMGRVVLLREPAGQTHEESTAILLEALDDIVPCRPTGRRGRVLVVDDNLMILRFVTRLLRRDHDVSAIGDPREALRSIAKGARYDAIVCDIMMPLKTGMDMYSELTVLAPAQAAKIVFITGFDTEQVRMFLDDVPNPRLEKPFPAAQLRELVNRHIDKK